MAMGAYVTLQGYQYYKKHYVPKCPLDHTQREISTKLEKQPEHTN